MPRACTPRCGQQKHDETPTPTSLTTRGDAGTFFRASGRLQGAGRRKPAADDHARIPETTNADSRSAFVVLSWLRGPDLNQRPSGYEPDELPGCSTPRLEERNYSKKRALTQDPQRPPRQGGRGGHAEPAKKTAARRRPSQALVLRLRSPRCPRQHRLPRDWPRRCPPVPAVRRPPARCVRRDPALPWPCAPGGRPSRFRRG